MKKRGQVSLEYVLIFSVVIATAIPTIYLFRNYVIESNNRIAEQNIEVAAKEIIDNARQIYYLGTSSRVDVEVEMPDNINNMYVLIKYPTIAATPGEYYLIIVYDSIHGEKTGYFESDIPLNPYPSTVCALGSIIPPPPASFTCITFDNKIFSPGKKSIRLETKTDLSGRNYVELKHLAD